MHGHALARVRDTKVHERSLATVGTCLSRLAADTLEYEAGQNYFRRMRKELMELCEALLDRQDGLNEAVLRQMDCMEFRIAALELSVPTCISHGDLQEGNIWVTNDSRVLIYDWETCGRRSVWYDPATLYCRMRSKGRDYDLLRYLRTDDRWLANDPCKYYSAEQYVGIADILSMEDVLFQMREAIQLTQYYRQKRAKEVMTAFAEAMEESIDDFEA